MKNDTLLYALGSAIRRLRDHKDYGLIKTIYQGLKEDGFDITKVGGSEAEQYLRMWLTYSFTAAISNSKDEDIKRILKYYKTAEDDTNKAKKIYQYVSYCKTMKGYIMRKPDFENKNR